MRSKNRTKLTICVAALAVAIAAPGVASAKPKVSINKFDGGKAARPFRKDVVKMLKKAGFVITRKAKKADAVVTGKVKRRRGKYLVRIDVRDASGEVVTDVKIKLRKRGFTKKRTFRKVARRLKAGVKRAKENAERVAESEVQDEDDSADDGDDTKDTGDDGDDTEQASKKDTADVEVSKSKAASAGPSSKTDISGGLAAGVSFVGRTLAIGSSGDDVASYDGIYAPGVRVDVEVAVNHKYVVEGYVDRAVGLKSGQRGAGETPLSTTQSRFGGAAYYRLSFGATKRAYIQAGLGAGQLEFSIADGADPVDVPDVAYLYVQPTVGLNVPVNAKVTAVAKAGVVLPLAAGEVVDGDHYGAASMIGYDVLAGAEYAFRPNLGLRGGVTYTRVNLTFDGTGTMQAQAGATDVFSGAFVTGAYRF